MAVYPKTVDPNGSADYARLSLWEAGEQALYVSGDEAIADCWRKGPLKDTTQVTVGGWPTGVIPKIIVNAAHRHEGEWADVRASDGNYVYIISPSTGTCITLEAQYAEIQGVAAQTSGGSGYIAVVYAKAPDTVVANNILRVTATGYRQHGYKLLDNSLSNAVVYNNIVYKTGASSSTYGVECRPSPGAGKVYNNTVYGFDNGITLDTSQTAKNNYVSAALNGYLSCSNTLCDYNVSSDTTAPGTNVAHNKTDYADYFVDPANGDFHLKAPSLSLWGLTGTDLSTTFTTDIDGQTRVNWDIGADEYITSGAVKINSDLALAFDLRSIASADFAAPFDAFGLAVVDAQLAYKIRTTADSSFAIPFNLKNLAVTNFNALYDIQGVINRANSDLVVISDIRITVAKDSTFLSGILETIASNLQTSYLIRSTTHNSIELVFDTQAMTTQELAIVADIITKASSQLTARYDLGDLPVTIVCNNNLTIGIRINL